MIKTFNLIEFSKTENFPFHIDMYTHQQDLQQHNHSYIELVFILDGTATHSVDGQEYALKAGDVFVINVEKAHGYKNVHDLKLCNIMFDFGKIISGDNELKKLMGFQSLFILEPYYRKEHKFESRLMLDPIKLQFVEDLLNMLLQEYEKKMEVYQSFILSYFNTLVYYLSRIYTVNDNPASERLFNLAGSIAYIGSNYLSPLKTNKLATMAYMSTRHFTRVFKQLYMISPTEYIIKQRLTHACELMKNDTLNLTQIALRSGFSDVKFFSRQFKVKYGVTPSQYRKNTVLK